MVKGDHLVKKHQIHVPEILYCLIGKLQLRLAVLDVIVGKISYQTSGKSRHIFQHRAFVFFQDLPNGISRMLHLLYVFFFSPILMDPADLKLSVCTGDLHGWLISQEGIASPYLCLAGTFQKIAVSAGCA